MARAAKIEQIQKAVKGANSLRHALAKVIAAGYAPIEVNLFRAMLAYFDNQPYSEVTEVHQHYVEYFNKAKNKIRCEIADLLVISFSESRCTMRASFIQAKREVVPQVRNKFRFHLAANQYQLLYNCPIIDPKGTGLPANIFSDACSDAISSYGVFYREGKDFDFAYEITSMLNPSEPLKQTGTMICCFSTLQNEFGQACRVKGLKQLHYDNAPWCYCNEALLSSLKADVFEWSLSRGKTGSPLIGKMARQIIRFIRRLHKDSPSEVSSRFAHFIAHYPKFWWREENGMSYIPNRRDDDNNRREEGDSNNIEWMMPRYIMLVDADRAEYRNLEER